MTPAGQPTATSVLITGASTGIGRACALRMHARGWRVFAGVRRSEDAEALRRETSEGLSCPLLDVTDQKSLRAAVEEVRQQCPEGLGGLVNNAGVAVPGPLEYVPADQLRRQLEVNVVGPLSLTQLALETLRAGRGRIVNISSVGGRSVLPFVGPYAASKYALEAISDALRRELHSAPVDVVLIEPGTIKTPMWDKGESDAQQLLQSLPPGGRELYGRAVERISQMARRRAERGLPPEAVARVVEHALTARRPRARYVVGREARAQIALFGLLPDRLVDRLLAAALRL